jgi:Fic family protein
VIYISIANMFREKKSISQEENLKQSFNKIKEELTEHLDSINQNTNEISANYEYIFELEKKIDKLNEKLDEALMFLSKFKEKTFDREIFRNITFNSREQEILLLLYARNGDLTSAKEIAKMLGLTEDKVNSYLSDIVSKGIPIVRKNIEGIIYHVLDYDFRNLQAKEQLIRFNESVIKEMRANKIL